MYAVYRVLVLNSSFSPIADGSASVFVGRASGCEQFPCNVSRGSSCSYRNFSLFCTPCLIDSYSPDGRSCIACALGQHASRDQRSCTDKREYTIDCAGEWSACSTDCRREWTQTAAPSGTGAACPAEPRCATGEDDCQSRFMLVLELVVVVCVLMCCCARFIKRCFSRQERAFKQLGDSDDTMELDAIERANVPDQSSSRGYTKVSKVTDEDGLESDTAPLVANASTT